MNNTVISIVACSAQTKLGRYPTRHDIDAVSAGVKVFLWRACWHIGLANSAALTACGIDLTKAPEAPPGGVIDFDGTSVTGILRERAVEVVMREICNKSNEEKKMFIKNGLDMCLRYGLTTVQTNDEGAMGIYQELMAADMLPIRVFLTPTHTDIFGSGDGAAPEGARPVVRPYGLPLGSTATSGGMFISLVCNENLIISHHPNVKQQMPAFPPADCLSIA